MIEYDENADVICSTTTHLQSSKQKSKTHRHPFILFFALFFVCSPSVSTSQSVRQKKKFKPKSSSSCMCMFLFWTKIFLLSLAFVSSFSFSALLSSRRARARCTFTTRVFLSVWRHTKKLSRWCRVFQNHQRSDYSLCYNSHSLTLSLWRRRRRRRRIKEHAFVQNEEEEAEED